jgi:hypothetical protein
MQTPARKRVFSCRRHPNFDLRCATCDEAQNNRSIARKVEAATQVNRPVARIMSQAYAR